MIGLETSLSLVMTQMVHTGLIDYNRLVEVMAINPRKVLRVEEVKLQAGSTADITIIDPDLEWTVTADSFVSKAKNSGFIGADLKGRATDVYVGGYATMQDGQIVE